LRSAVGHADHDVADALAAASALEREHVRRLVLAAVAAVERAQPRVAAEEQRHLAAHPQRARRAPQHASDPGAAHAAPALAIEDDDAQGHVTGGAYFAGACAAP
jgi:hypothetical protein